MEFRILGPLELGTGDRVIALGGTKQRAVLAVLLLHLNEVVTIERLIDEVWGDAAPATASKSVQVYVSGLRKALRESAVGGGELVTRSGGYVLQLDPDAVDARRFERLVAQGRSELEADRSDTAAALLRDALALWGGPPLVDFRYAEFAQAEIARLDELHLTALEDRIDADLALGHHAHVVAELERLVATHPLRERFWGQLMLALYRCGRQADALEAYRRACRFLAEEVGLAPGPALQRLEQAILNQQPDLDAAQPARAAALPPVAPRDVRGRLVGREAELGALTSQWRRAREGERRVVALSGEPGIGKTRLAAELCASAHEQGDLVLLGRCHEDALIPYEPFVEALRRYVSGASAEALRAELGPEGAVLAALVPELGSDVAAPRELAAARLVEAIVVLVEQAARSRPAILVLEDVHWAEDATAVALRHLVRGTESVPLLVVLTYRATELADPHPIIGALADTRRARALTELELGGLDEPSVGAIVAANMETDAPADLVAAVHVRTGGNPYFVEELIRDAFDRDEPERLVLPQSIKDLIGRRLRGMRSEDVRLLEAAAVIGTEFDPQVLGDATGCSEAAVVDGLDAASRARVVVASAAPGTYAFAHGLVRETVYGSLSDVRRAYLHRRVGEALEAHDDADGRRAAALAHHFSAGGDPGRARPHHAAAARAAARVGALQAGLDHCDAALAGTPVGTDDPLVAVVALERGRLIHRAGRIPDAIVSLEQALGAARALNDADLEVDTLLELGLLRRSTDVAGAMRPLEEALAIAERLSDTPAQVRALSRSALIYADQLRLDRARDLAEQALGLARRHGDERVMADALDALKLVAWQLGDSDELARLSAELESIQRRHGDLWGLSWTLLEAAQVPMAALDWAAAEARLGETLALSERIGAPASAGLVLDSLATVHEARGAPEAALAACVRSVQLFERAGHVSLVGWAEATAGLVLIRLRAGPRAIERLRYGLHLSERSRSRQAILRCTALLARAEWLSGDHAGALARARRAADLCGAVATPPGAALLYVAPALACVAEVLAAAGEPGRGEALVSGPLAAAKGKSRALYAIPLSIAAARCQAALGHPEAAESALAPALGGTHAQAWEAHAVLGALHRAAGRQAGHEAAAGAARSAVTAVAEGVRDTALRTGFLAAAEREISA